MIKLEQIRELNEKVQSTLEVVRLLREENGILKDKLSSTESRVKELEALVSSFRNDQDEIEDGIKGILLQLDRLEEEFTAPPAPRSAAEEVTDEPSSEEVENGAAAPEAENAPEAEKSSNPVAETVSSPVEESTDPEEGSFQADEKPSEAQELPEKAAAPAASDNSDTPNPSPLPEQEPGETELDIF